MCSMDYLRFMFQQKNSFLRKTIKLYSLDENDKKIIEHCARYYIKSF